MFLELALDEIRRVFAGAKGLPILINLFPANFLRTSLEDNKIYVVCSCCLFHPHCTDSLSYQVNTREYKEGDWDRFDYYASRIRIFNNDPCHFKWDMNAYQEFSKACERRPAHALPLLPCATIISTFTPRENEFSLLFLTYSLGPRLVSLTIDASFTRISTTVGVIIAACHLRGCRLRSLIIKNSGVNGWDQPPIDGMHSFQGLTKLAIPAQFISVLGKKYFASLPLLRSLEIVDGPSRRSKQSRPSKSWPAINAPFRSLRTIRGSSWFIIPVISIMQRECLTQVNITLPRNPCSIDDIRPLFPCTSLQYLTLILTLRRYNPTDADYEVLTQYWPNMNRFHVKTETFAKHLLNRHHMTPPNATLQSLFKLCKAWKQLHTIKLPLDATAMVKEHLEEITPLMRTDRELSIEVWRWRGVIGREQNVQHALRRLLLPGCQWSFDQDEIVSNIPDLSQSWSRIEAELRSL